MMNDAQLARLLMLGPGEAMRQSERDAGHEIIRAGDRPWLTGRDWPENIVVARAGRTIRIVAIYALVPGTGAFSRMIDGIIDDGFTPVVVTPFSQMKKILTRWGWTANFREEWRPTRQWMARRREGKTNGTRRF